MTWLKDFMTSLTPGYWLQNNHYCEKWDRELNELLKTKKFQPIDKCTARIGERTVWIKNHPYASFSPWPSNHVDVRPRRITIARAHKKLLEDLI